jgi:hypothetical protein
MRKVVTLVAAATTMAVLGLLIFLLEKTKTGEEWALMAAWFRLCDWFLPNSRPASSHQSESATTLPPQVGGVPMSAIWGLRARAALATQR